MADPATAPASACPSEVLDDLDDAAVTLAAELRLTQGAGGNLSKKVDGVLWVKASGTRLAEAAERRIFLPMDLRLLRDLVLVTEDLEPAMLGAGTGARLRPSIETAFHALLPHPFVFHVHSVGAIAVSVGEPSVASARLEGLGRFVFVPYTRPGLPLANALFAALGADPDPGVPLVAVLGNHGLLVAGATAQECLALIEAVESRLAAPFERFTDAEPGPSGEWERRSAPGSVTREQADLLCAGPLTPDSAVFLGARPFSADFTDAGPAVIDDEGAVWLRRGVSADAADIAASLIGVARSVIEPGPFHHLSSEDVRMLTGWDAEIWRKGQER